MKKSLSIIILLFISFLFYNFSKLPVEKSDKFREIYFADPSIYSEKGKYYMIGTRNLEPLGFIMLESNNLVDWKVSSSSAKEGFVLKKGRQAYGEIGFWAPQVIKEKKSYYLTYTANEQVTLATAKKANGIFKQNVVKPIDSSAKNIDSFLFKDDDGKYYIYHVRFNKGNFIWGAEFDLKAGSIKKETLTQCFGLSQPWEATKAYKSVPIMEGPTVIKMNGVYYLFYSANHFKSVDYGVGYATSKNPLGPWTKYPGNPIIHRSIVKENGSGHGDLFFDKKNNPYYVYHVHNSESMPEPRKTRIVPLKFVFNSSTNIYDISVKADNIIIPKIKM